MNFLPQGPEHIFFEFYAFFVVRKYDSLNFWSRIFQDVKPAFDSVGNVNQTVRIDIKIVEHGRLLSFRRGWNEVAYFLRAELVSDVEDRRPAL